jgi:hypothetical protein
MTSTPGKLAMIAGRLASIPHGVRSDRQEAHACASTQEQAADRVGVSRRSPKPGFTCGRSRADTVGATTEQGDEG